MDRIVLGINRSQDASICLLKGNSIVAAISKERLTRRKHDWGGDHDFETVYVPAIPELAETTIDAVVECFSTVEPSADQKAQYHDELRRRLKLAPDARFFRLSHHYAHLCSAFVPSEFEHAAAMVIDAQGSLLTNLTESWDYPSGDPRLREIMSFYSCNSGEPRCVAKQVWDGTRAASAGLGMFYYLLTQTMFPGEGKEGKVMGLASHGNSARVEMPPLLVDENRVSFSPAWRTLLVDEPVRHRPLEDGAGFLKAADFAAAGQKAFEDALIEVARWLHGATGMDQLCFAGGTALNCSANTRLLTDTPFKRLFIPPAPHDAGTALGCAIYGMRRLNGTWPSVRWVADYLGPASGLDGRNLAAEASDGWHWERPSSFWDRLADLIAAGRTVGLAQGRSEFGPRAFGNRSILADPRRPEMRDHVNRNIKGREWFRPLAPAVPLEDAGRYFVLDRACPFMQWTVEVRNEWRDKLPSIVHVDGSARLQTVTPEQNYDLYHLLKRFGARSGIPVLLNTSLNGQDEPLVESETDALRCFSSTALDVLAMPPVLISKKA